MYYANTRTRQFRLAFVLLAAGLVIMTAAPAAQAGAVPRQISYQGLLTDDTGNLVPDGDYTIDFRLYNDPWAGTRVWDELQTVTTVNGVFDVQLGSITPLTTWTFYNPMWLTMLIEGTSVSTPRVPLLSTPYAFRAAALEDSALTYMMIADGTLVRSVNNVRDNVKLVAGANVSISQAGSDITISAIGGTGGDDGDWAIDGANLNHSSTGTVALGTATSKPMTSGQTMLQVEALLWPGLALDRSEPNFQRWLMWQEGIYNQLQFSHTMSTNDQGTPVLVLDTDGDVGVGVSLPAARLDILGGDGDLTTTSGDLQIGNDYHRLRLGVHTGGAAAGEVNLWAMSPTGTPSLQLGVDDHDVVNVNSATMDFLGDSGDLLVQLAGDPGETQGGVLTLYGHLPTVQQRIQLDAQNSTNAVLALRTDDGQFGVRAVSGSGASGGSVTLYDDLGVAAIEIDATYNGGSGRIRTPTLEITGGSDLSEQFTVNALPQVGDLAAAVTPRPGMVVAVDPDNPGELMLSDISYDRRVAGVISGAGGVSTGMMMGQAGSIADGDHPVALTGRVYVWVDASEHPVVPGDLLTTSSLPGHAMKVTDYSHAMGAVLGKAMTGLDSGRGLVLTLVSLQ